MVLNENSQLHTEKYQLFSNVKERHSLYLRFPKKLNADRTLAENEVKSLHSKIIQVRIPRQRSANFCLIDFETEADKEKASKKLKKLQIGKLKLRAVYSIEN